MDNHFDVLISGAGLVGKLCALTLADQGFNVGLLYEQDNLQAASTRDEDKRAIALTYASVLALQKNNYWHVLENDSYAVKQVHVSEQGHYGTTRIDARDYQLPALGYVIDAKVMNRHFLQLMKNKRITPYYQSKLLDYRLDKQNIVINTTSQTLVSKLLVGADGTESTVRNRAGFQISRKDYGQSALITHIRLMNKGNRVAYERFCAEGPLALLPIDDTTYAVVWVNSSERTRYYQTLGDAQFIEVLQQHIGYRIGKIDTCEARQIFPLQQLICQSLATKRVILLGNAAHTLHPIAAQGFNLALRDIFQLAKLLSDGGAVNFGENLFYKKYQETREKDITRTHLFTDKLLQLFLSQSTRLQYSRSLGRVMLNNLGPLKRQFANMAMGMR